MFGMALLRLIFATFFMVIFLGLTSAQYSFTLYQTTIPAGTTDLNQLNSSLPTYFVIHGWMQSATQPWLLQIKDAYLTLAAANVVVFNWAPFSQDINYFASALAVAPAGQFLGQKIVTLSTTGNITIATTQVIGFCLGGHVAGVAGQFFKTSQNVLLEVIVGLDVPITAFPSDTDRLSIDDAKFVQAFHTSDLGRPENYGHVDVYFNYEWFNWGINQPNCPAVTGVNVPIGFVPIWCDHIRSVAYWIESIPSTNKFLAVKCSCWVNQVNTCGSATVLIGRGINTALTGKYCLKTNGANPFGKGLMGVI